MNEKWKIKVVNEEGRFPFLIIDNWYTDDELKLIWKELDFYLKGTPKEDLHRIEDGKDVARAHGKALARGYRWFPTVHFRPDFIHLSPIMRTITHVQNEEFWNIIEKIIPWGRTFKRTNKNDCIVTYYDEDDEYKSHIDEMIWTQLVWLAKDENDFDGGDLALKDAKQTIKFKHNRCVFFPSCYVHQSTPIKFKKQNPQLGDGKFTITHFYWRDE